MRTPTSLSLLQDYFSAKGYTFETMVLGQAPYRRFVTMKSPEGNYITLSTLLPVYPFATASGQEIIDNKIKTYDFAKLLGVTVPATHVMAAKAYNKAAVTHMLDAYKTLVVKPHDSYQSRGVTINVTSLDDLSSAIADASAVSDTVLVQQQIHGEELRFIAIDGAIRAILHSKRPSVVGDGTATVAELITAENKARREMTNSLLDYPQLDGTIIANDLLTDERIPAKGEEVILANGRMIYHGASIYNIFSAVHPSYIKIAQTLTERFGKGLVAVDLIVQDYTHPAQPHNYTLLEMNKAISMPMCYSCRDGNHFYIIEDYLGPMLEKVIT